MSACTFFGYCDCSESVQSKLRTVLVELIEYCGVNQFYVGQQGTFDAMVLDILQKLASEYPYIRYDVVSEKLPSKYEQLETFPIIFPDELENVPSQFAISRRNDWMLQQADYVVTYAAHSWDNAAQYGEKAAHLGKIVLNLAQKSPVKNKTRTNRFCSR
jgi:uncharacterized phage-like protein YoqJ